MILCGACLQHGNKSFLCVGGKLFPQLPVHMRRVTRLHTVVVCLCVGGVRGGLP